MNQGSVAGDELIQFQDEPGQVPGASSVANGDERVWRILIIDDDPDVHQATLFALEGVTLFGRSLVFLHAHSAQEAKRTLLEQPDLALVLLDVVMETPSAGLELVGFIRNSAGLMSTRIILRTGQPGYAPEHDTILRYDINDYKTKSELTHHKLLTAVTAAVRSYDQLCTIEASRRGLELIVQASGSLMQAQGLSTFAAGVITQLAALLGTKPEGLVCAQGERGQGQYTVLAAAGQFSGLISQPLGQLSDHRVGALLQQSLQQRRSLHADHESVLYFGASNGMDMAAYVGTDMPLKALDSRLLDVFCANLNACLRNQTLIQRLQTEAYVDPLLRLPNRVRFIEELSARLQAPGDCQTLVLLDVDDFASVNDLMGHVYGDHLLQALATRLADHLGSEVILARVAGDSFGLLGPTRSLSPERIQAAVAEPLVISKKPHRVSVTCGMAELDESVLHGADWLKNVSIALKQAKRQSRGTHLFYTSDMASLARNRAQTLTALHSAFDQDHLFLVYQPQVDLATGELVGLEALMRWRTEDGQLVPPDQFIPVAEQSGLIVSMGDWVLQTACVAMRQLVNAGCGPKRMAVNVSVVQFQSPGFLERVQRALTLAGLSGEQLELEITESVAMLGSGVVESLLQRLRSARISVAIDDFGTGYSSLSYLEKLPLDRIKIDKAFVRHLGQPDGPRIAEMITQLGHKLGLRVLAEGVEDMVAWQALQAMGCHEGQGYHIARPMELHTLMEWLAKRAHTP